MLVLKGDIFIFVRPNQESILAFVLTTQQKMKNPLRKIYYGTKIHDVNEMKAVIPYYA